MAAAEATELPTSALHPLLAPVDLARFAGQARAKSTARPTRPKGRAKARAPVTRSATRRGRRGEYLAAQKGRGKGRGRGATGRSKGAFLEIAEDYDSDAGADPSAPQRFPTPGAWGKAATAGGSLVARQREAAGVSTAKRNAPRAVLFPSLKEANDLAQRAQAAAKALVAPTGQLLLDDALAALRAGPPALAKAIIGHLPHSHAEALKAAVLAGRVPTDASGSEVAPSLFDGDAMNSSLLAADQRERVFWLTRAMPDGQGPAPAPPPPLRQGAERSMQLFEGGALAAAVRPLVARRALDPDEQAHPQVRATWRLGRPAAEAAAAAGAAKASEAAVSRAARRGRGRGRREAGRGAAASSSAGAEASSSAGAEASAPTAEAPPDAGTGGALSIVEQQRVFELHLDVFSHGMLRGVLGKGTVLAGSAVVACLQRGHPQQEVDAERQLDLIHVLRRCLLRGQRRGPGGTRPPATRPRASGLQSIVLQVLAFAGEPSLMQELDRRFNGGGSPFQAGDLDVYVIAPTREAAAARLSQAAQAVHRNMEAFGDVVLVRTPNALTLCGAWPLRHVQLIVHVFETVSELLVFADMDCTAVAFDGSTVWAAPRALRAFATGYNFVPPRMLVRRRGTAQRMGKYCKRGFGSLTFDLCKHTPRCDIQLDRHGWDALCAAEMASQEPIRSLADVNLGEVLAEIKPLVGKDPATVGTVVAATMRKMRHADVALLPRGPEVTTFCVEAYARMAPRLAELGLVDSPKVEVISLEDATPAGLLPQMQWLRDKNFSWGHWGMIPCNHEQKRKCRQCQEPISSAQASAPPPATSEARRGEAQAAPGESSSPAAPAASSFLRELLDSCKMREEELARARRCAQELQKLVDAGPLAGASVDLFGSVVNGLGTRGSDIDMTVRLKPVKPVKPGKKATQTQDADSDSGKEEQRRALLTLKDAIEGHSSVFAFKGIRLHARVPLLLLTFEGEVEVDVSVDNDIVLCETRMMQAYIALDERVRELALLVKLWVKKNRICGASAGFPSSWAYSLMVIYYLQVGSVRVPYLPLGGRAEFGQAFNSDERAAYQVERMRKEKEAWSEWNNEQPVEALFKGFFDFYTRDFKWGTEVVSVRHGRRLDSATADEFNPWNGQGLKEQGLAGRHLTRLHIEDAFAPTKNLHDTVWHSHEHVVRDTLVAAQAALEASNVEQAFAIRQSVPQELTCKACGELNATHRAVSPDLTGKTAVVVGGRLGVGYETALRLLRLGAKVAVLSRFPQPAADKFARDPRAEGCLDRLHIYGCDLRIHRVVLEVCDLILVQHPAVDLLVLTPPPRNQEYNCYEWELAELDRPPGTATSSSSPEARALVRFPSVDPRVVSGDPVRAALVLASHIAYQRREAMQKINKDFHPLHEDDLPAAVAELLRSVDGAFPLPAGGRQEALRATVLAVAPELAKQQDALREQRNADPVTLLDLLGPAVSGAAGAALLALWLRPALRPAAAGEGRGAGFVVEVVHSKEEVEEPQSAATSIAAALAPHLAEHGIRAAAADADWAGERPGSSAEDSVARVLHPYFSALAAGPQPGEPAFGLWRHFKLLR